MAEDNVKVAVRVRPFNDKESQRHADCVISMEGNQTTIKDPKGKAKPHTFTFDHSYWSHDGFTERADGYFEPEGSKYADQNRVFNDLGLAVLDNAWEGYNCCLFAYGQTGSGKSYSTFGDKGPKNPGLVPMCCEKLFAQIDEKGGGDTEYQVSLSMLEIYCEKVRDLLTRKAPPKSGLRVREHAKKGFYVENLTTVPVGDYATIESKVSEGNEQKTVHATNMNATSSRAHTIVQIIFTQKSGAGEGGRTHKRSIINLVDLAGSERQKDAKTEGDRLKEGIVINQSLSTLGRCISALADIQVSKKKQQVPYRDSVLTSLLKNALGGNSKTLMIAALSPADSNYEETLSTLRYADSAKRIKTKAVVNESASDKLIRELKEENARLQSMLAAGGVVDGGAVPANDEELENLRMQLEQNKREMADMEQNWSERLAGTALTTVNMGEIREKKRNTPHLWNLNEDPGLTDMIVHFVNEGENKIGCQESDDPNHINLAGLAILEQHAIIQNDDNKKFTLTARFGANILVNGQPIKTNTVELHHNDRVHFGGSHLYVFSHPHEQAKKKGSHVLPTYDMAQAEIARNMGIMTDGKKTEEDMILEEELIRLLPLVSQANAMALELDKKCDFEIVLVAPEARGKRTGHTEVMVKLHNQMNDNEFLWHRDQFIDRYYGMQEHYQEVYDCDQKPLHVNRDSDPFYEPPDKEVMIGISQAYLKSIAYLVEVDEKLPITDYKGNDKGYIQVEVIPCKEDGTEIVGKYVENPKDLVGKTLNIKVKLLSAIGLNRRYISSRCLYRFFGEDSGCATMEVTGSNPSYAHEKVFHFKPVTQQIITQLEEEALIVEVYGKQSDKKIGKNIPAGPYSMSNEKAEAMQQKLERIDLLLANAKNAKARSIPVAELRKALAEDNIYDDVEMSEPEDSSHEKKKRRPSSKGGRGHSGRERSASGRERSASGREKSASGREKSAASHRDGSANKDRRRDSKERRHKK